MDKVLDEVANENQIPVLKIAADSDEGSALAVTFKVRTVPALFFVEGDLAPENVKHSFQGFRPKADIVKIINDLT
jgi:hypothetical protein